MRDTEQGKNWGSQAIQTVIRGCINTFSHVCKSLTHRFLPEKSGGFRFGPFKPAFFRSKFPFKPSNRLKNRDFRLYIDEGEPLDFNFETNLFRHGNVTKNSYITIRRHYDYC